MTDDVLSQDEKDDLAEDASTDSQPTTYFEAQATLFKELAGRADLLKRYPVLTLVFEDFSAQLGESLSNTLNTEITVTQKEFNLVKFGAFEQAEDSISSITLFSLDKSQKIGLITFNQVAVKSIINRFFGSDSLPESDERQKPTSTEMDILYLLCNQILEEFAKAWSHAEEINLSSLRSLTDIRYIDSVVPTEVYLQQNYTISFAEQEACFCFLFPFHYMDSIEDKLVRNGEKKEKNSQEYNAEVKREIHHVPLEIHSTLANFSLTFGEIFKLGIGDVIPIDKPDSVVVYSDNIPLYRAHFGVADGHYALKIIEKT